MATHRCCKKEHGCYSLMKHMVLKLLWDLGTWLTALAHWMLRYSESSGDFEFWFSVWPDTIPMLHARWLDLLILTDCAIAHNSPVSQHNFWYPAGTRCWQGKCCALRSADAAVTSIGGSSSPIVCPLEVTSMLSSANGWQANKNPSRKLDVDCSVFWSCNKKLICS